MESTRVVNLYMARLAERVGRYDDMVEFIEKVAAEDEELNEDERFLLADSFKHITTACRNSWRTVSTMENSEEIRGKDDPILAVKDFKAKIEYELSSFYDHFLTLVDSKCIPFASTAGEHVLYQKLKGNYYRYLAEFRTGSDRSCAIGNALSAYRAAQEIALELLPTDVDRLGLALNYAVFHYETLNIVGLACSIAQKAYDEAVTDDSYMETNVILELLKDNLAIWASGEHVHLLFKED